MRDDILRTGNDCHCRAMPEVTRLQVRGATVVMVGLREQFKEWRAENLTPGELSDQQILRAIRERNYVPEIAAADYAAAVRELYSARR